MFNVTCFYMRFVHIIIHLEMQIHEIVGHHGLELIIHHILKRNSGNQDGNESELDRYKCPTIPQGYGCFVCGSTFETNQERVMHLEKFRHLDLHNTGTPQEGEEVRRLFLATHKEAFKAIY